MYRGGCLACGFDSGQERERRISEALVAGEVALKGHLRRVNLPRYELSEMDERNLRALREMA